MKIFIRSIPVGDTISTAPDTYPTQQNPLMAGKKRLILAVTSSRFSANQQTFGRPILFNLRRAPKMSWNARQITQRQCLNNRAFISTATYRKAWNAEAYKQSAPVL